MKKKRFSKKEKITAMMARKRPWAKPAAAKPKGKGKK